MSETVVKMGSLACTVASIFLVLFGLYVPVPSPWASTVLVLVGVILLIAGSVCFAVYRED